MTTKSALGFALFGGLVAIYGLVLWFWPRPAVGTVFFVSKAAYIKVSDTEMLRCGGKKNSDALASAHFGGYWGRLRVIKPEKTLSTTGWHHGRFVCMPKGLKKSEYNALNLPESDWWLQQTSDAPENSAPRVGYVYLGNRTPGKTLKSRSFTEKKPLIRLKDTPTAVLTVEDQFLR